MSSLFPFSFYLPTIPPTHSESQRMSEERACDRELQPRLGTQREEPRNLPADDDGREACARMQMRLGSTEAHRNRRPVIMRRWRAMDVGAVRAPFVTTFLPLLRDLLGRNESKRERTAKLRGFLRGAPPRAPRRKEKKRNQPSL